MIESVSGLLEAFIREESKKADDFEKSTGDKMVHMPTLGDAYEKITKQGIDKEYILPKELDLKVVSGFIRIDGIMCGKQIDCMLVRGEGQRYLLTNEYIYDVDNVLCVFEVKKTLNKKDFRDAMEHQYVLREAIGNYIDKIISEDGRDLNVRIESVGSIYSFITGKKYPENEKDIEALSESERDIYVSVLKEQISPLFIIHGYNGIKTERGLRGAFCDLIEEFLQDKQDKVKVNSLPNLITSNELSLVKSNGVPFLSSCEDEWVIYTSARYNVARLMIDMIWSKISIYFNVSMPFHDELYQENLDPLLKVNISEENGKVFWGYSMFRNLVKGKDRDDDCSWVPYKISKAAVFVVSVMSLRGGYLSNDDYSDGSIENMFGVKFSSVIDELMNSKLFMRDGECIRQISTLLHIADLDEEGGYISNDMHKLRLWCEKENYLHSL